MTKTLQSGIQVEDTEYYKLLEWKDRNLTDFLSWCVGYTDSEFSINNFNKEQYQSLLKFAGI